MAVKMRPNYCRTKRPRAALLQLGIGKYERIVQNRWDPAVGGGPVRYHPFVYVFLTNSRWRREMGHCLVGSLTGEVAPESVTGAYKGWLRSNGNRSGSTKAEASLIARLTSQASAKAGLSDLRIPGGLGSNLSDKSYAGDNRLVTPKRTQRRRGSAPRCRLSASWG